MTCVRTEVMTGNLHGVTTLVRTEVMTENLHGVTTVVFKRVVTILTQTKHICYNRYTLLTESTPFYLVLINNLRPRN